MTDIIADFDNISVVFGDKPQTALPLMDKGLERAKIQAQTDQILGVHNCTLQLKRGEVLVLMGLSGSGKSTLLRVVNGLNPITRGQLTLATPQGAIEISTASNQQMIALRRQHIAMVFQQFGLLPWRSVAENVGLGLELSGLSKTARAKRVATQLHLVGLESRADARVAELSGGMQQRVGLARAYATEASVLLMDEPFSALDPLIRTHLQNELLDHQKKLNCSIIFVSHDLDEAFKLGDRIAIMEGGRIVQIGTPRDIFHQPSTEYVANFVAQINPMNILNAGDIVKFSQLPPPKKTSKILSNERAHQGLDINTPATDIVAGVEANTAPLIITKEGSAIGQIDKSSVITCLSHYTLKAKKRD